MSVEEKTPLVNPTGDVNPKWEFKPQSKSDMNVDPTHDEFFTTEHVGGLPSALVRETIQNSLDARDPDADGPVLVRFGFHEIDPSQGPETYMAGLEPHLRACKNGVVASPDFGRPIQVLTVEDFSTVGLEGDPLESSVDPNDDRDHNFYYFWRNIGRSEKKEGDRGRWGLGKAVFPVASTARTFYGYTMRRSDTRRLLMGHCLVKIHALGDGRQFQPYGHFGLFNDPEDEFFVHPVEDASYIAQFCERFDLSRGGQAGLSLVIPFLRPAITPRAVLQSVLREYFYAILAGFLTVEVLNLGSSTQVSAGNLDELANELDDEAFDAAHFHNLLEFSRWALEAAKGDELIALPSQDPGKAPSWRNIELAPESLSDLKAKFDHGDRLAFFFPTKVQLEGKPSVAAAFKLFLERDKAINRAEDHFIRQGLRISGISSLRQRGVRAMVVVDEDPLVTMLGDAENPAHTEWQRDARGFQEKYHTSYSCLRFVTASPKEMARILVSVEQQVDEHLLEEFFYFPELDATEEPDDLGDIGTGGGGTGPVTVPPIRSKPAVRIVSLQDGFSLRSCGDRPTPRLVTLEVAYKGSRGDPFRHHSPLDFDLANGRDIEITCVGTEVPSVDRNSLSFVVIDPEFEVTLRGFDPNRDVAVRVDVEAPEE